MLNRIRHAARQLPAWLIFDVRQKMRSVYIAHSVSSLAMFGAIALLKNLDTVRIDHMLTVGAAFGVCTALLTRWWSVAYFAVFMGCVVGLGAIGIAPFLGDFGVLPAIVISLFTLGAACVGAIAVALSRTAVTVYRRSMRHDKKA